MTQPSMSDSHELAAPTDHPPDKKMAPAADEASDRVDQSHAVLIVEDDFLIAMQAEAALLDAGFRVTGIATTAEEALTMAREQMPALAIMDIRLAGRRDGVEAAGDLFRELGLRCVFATAHDDLLTRTRAEPFAPLGWLSKPYTMASLTSVVRASLARPD
ncbi:MULTISPECIES: response regulator [Bradyrhizobium]|uniref:Response regulator n=2 Tax=Nitrobacteraceae TaxID=41294 RepID=A0AAE7TM18_9BRAD|nr:MULTISPECIES: response regulator [Bradyrhizobium]KMJ95117.1 regulator [Bradyrhizobium japonicum]MBR0764760.1 response regulator [Bradyrhizobium japonicum]MCS3533283.1 DNA-binding response OmpR family regulator [Bradyrhizobium japonicum]MCS3990623.1 DNA-binding response OmpR family regulator [Bradyrhizobium japonicum]MCS4014563.1 DNA-binding response OmpR family regulator [Bradyrhizobium japonicum]